MVHVATAGAVGTRLDIDLEADGIRNFAAATLSRAAGAATDSAGAPAVAPTFLPARIAPAGEPAIENWPGIPIEQDHRFFGPPPRAGERLSAHSRIQRVYEADDDQGTPVTMVEMVTQYFDRTGRLVAESWMTGIRPVSQESA
ncbi:MaoC family dehydratase N-terminal domain-containing protein [Nocardia cyriacigeorgica]|uniref:FAS1-like dehydratase domain-containing protein n=1 Tax=Nocardia cyriacigeorgica TaxID=135487 RepID=UPI0018951E67|nr:MaoC family dehydratase N-terminal domain-containing protein [Nocardia cyriacigeorgica]MBF6089932.1 MaoC family dehydratase N-terminal domain-containing protein [Nocardia cyriacigeorgica]MBF6100358.1 MaoC family dehydratase N-terminal domain-containing protein [Nocardia cyriacigeorgica]MBF6399610.1 MaoC family dehydratase N-terminal domain-containing protein [Nocardia cyriacigeorgica]MBF6405240.1 MaoC family dehydratase N-terminal domain-containing protein [Nocardia cyriacigeorgica]